MVDFMSNRLEEIDQWPTLQKVKSLHY